VGTSVQPGPDNRNTGRSASFRDRGRGRPPSVKNLSEGYCVIDNDIVIIYAIWLEKLITGMRGRLASGERPCLNFRTIAESL
jgi:hypothetical protein